MKGRKKTEGSAADGWKEEVVCVSFSFSGCGSDIPDTVVLFKASQTNKLIQFESLIYLIREATNTQSSSSALTSNDRLESPQIKFFWKLYNHTHINIFGLDFADVRSCICSAGS